MRNAGWLAAALTTLAVGPLCAQDLNGAQKAQMKDFVKRVQAYEALEHSLPVGAIKPTSDVDKLEEQRVEMRKEMQAARPDPKQGDFFTPEAADTFRLILGKAMAGEHGDEIRTSLAHAEPIAPKDLHIGMIWPDTKGSPLQSSPPSLLKHLPELPRGLEYRVAGRELALRDTEANLVVDVLPDALP